MGTFIPGDTVVSMAPGAVFEIHLRNPGGAAQSGTLAFNFPGFGPQEGIERRPLTGPLQGVLVESGRQGDAWEMAYVLAATDGEAAVDGGALNADKAGVEPDR